MTFRRVHAVLSSKSLYSVGQTIRIGGSPEYGVLRVLRSTPSIPYVNTTPGY
jgi:hypothetical protein